MCKKVSVIEPSKVVPFPHSKNKYLYQPLPPTPPLKSTPEEPVTIPTVSAEVKKETSSALTVSEESKKETVSTPTVFEESKKETDKMKSIEEPAPTFPSTEPTARNELIQIQPKSFLKSSFHRRLYFGTYVGSVVGVSAAILYHLRYEFTNPNLLPAHMLLLLITFKLLYIVRHFKD